MTTFLPIDPRTAGQFVKVSHDKQYDGFLKPAEFNNIRARVCVISVSIKQAAQQLANISARSEAPGLEVIVNL